MIIIHEVYHEVYRYSEYPKEQSGLFVKAIEVVSVAISVGLLQALTFAPANDSNFYALQQGALRRNGGTEGILTCSMHRRVQSPTPSLGGSYPVRWSLRRHARRSSCWESSDGNRGAALHDRS